MMYFKAHFFSPNNFDKAQLIYFFFNFPWFSVIFKKLFFNQQSQKFVYTFSSKGFIAKMIYVLDKENDEYL